MLSSTADNDISLVNGISGDPGVLVFFKKVGSSILFDLGNLEAMAHRDLLKVRQVFVSHTHIDHFIGFDRLLRVNIPHARHLEISGPEGIIGNVQGKLRGFHWNLLASKQIQFTVHEIHRNGSVKTAYLCNDDEFFIHPNKSPEPVCSAHVRPVPEKPVCFVTNLDDKSRIEAVALDHGTPSIAYACQSYFRFSVNTLELQKLGLTPGPWIRDLQIAMANGHFGDSIVADGKTYKAGELGKDVLVVHTPKYFGYLTDIAFSRKNLERVVPLLLDAELLVCETNFADTDIAKAKQKKHLTTKQAALIAASARVDKLEIFHVSNVYHGSQADVSNEAQAFFRQFKSMHLDQIEQELLSEEARLAKISL